MFSCAPRSIGCKGSLTLPSLSLANDVQKRNCDEECAAEDVADGGRERCSAAAQASAERCGDDRAWDLPSR